MAPTNVASSSNISIGGNGAGIGAVSAAGPANVTSSGTISIGGNGAGIDAEGTVVQVTSSGNILLANGGQGIIANGTNAATVNSSGAIAVIGGDLSSGIEATGGVVAVTSSARLPSPAASSAPASRRPGPMSP